MADYTPTPEDHFAFGLWTIGHPGRDPFGEATRPPLPPGDFVRGLADIGAWGVSFHDDDLMTFGADESERRRQLAQPGRQLLDQPKRKYQDGRSKNPIDVWRLRDDGPEDKPAAQRHRHLFS